MEIKSRVTRFAGLLCIAGALQGFPVIYSANPGGIISVARQGTYHLTGTIVDGYGEPVIGANVVEKGTTNGAVTDIDGKFSLEVAPDAVLTISFIGYISKEITLKGERAENYKEDLTHNIMPFWLKNGLDKEHGGIYTCEIGRASCRERV